MGANESDIPERAGSPLGGQVAAHIAAIVEAAEREARSAERAIEERRRTAEEEIHRYLAATRMQVDAEAAARAARLESLSTSARRLAEELADASAAVTRELRRADEEVASTLPRAPWPAPAPAAEPAAAEPAAPEPPAATWSRVEPTPAPPAPEAPPAEPAPTVFEPGADVPSAARLVAIEMAVGGSSRAEVEAHLRERLGVHDAGELLDDVFGAASHASSRLAWGEP